MAPLQVKATTSATRRNGRRNTGVIAVRGEMREVECVAATQAARGAARESKAMGWPEKDMPQDMSRNGVKVSGETSSKPRTRDPQGATHGRAQVNANLNT